MRDILLIGTLAVAVIVTLRYPMVGVLTWTWFSLMSPHQLAYGAQTLQLNLIVAVATAISVVVSGAFRHFRMDSMTGLFLAFAFWLMLSQVFSVAPENSAPFFDRFVKTLLFAAVCIQLATDRLKFHALVWIFVIAIGYFALKGALFTVVTLGEHRVQGVERTILEDNNHLGTAIATILPLVLYLKEVSARPLIRAGLLALFVAGIVAVIGTHSRGAFVALVVFAGYYWLRSQRKVLLLAGLAAVALPAIAFMPAKWTDRMTTISEATQDSSFMGRVDAWVINAKLAAAHPLTGVGMRNSYVPEIAASVDRERAQRAKAAHSIYFEVLGGSGYVGLALMLSVIAAAFVATARLKALAKVAGVDSWIPKFGYFAQISLAVFCVGGAAVSMEMWDGFWLLIALIAVARRLSKVPVGAPAARPAEAARGWRLALRAAASRPALNRKRANSP
jgi:probable O-glycosylation ligase (exosortase A-associated)